jgi:hypothetical protein
VQRWPTEGGGGGEDAWNGCVFFFFFFFLRPPCPSPVSGGGIGSLRGTLRDSRDSVAGIDQGEGKEVFTENVSTSAARVWRWMRRSGMSLLACFHEEDSYQCCF